MASFTDIIPKFNPYIQQLPVDAMVRVGMEKQKRYDEGIQKIQTQIDNIAGLDVIRDIDKAYLQSKLNELGNNLRTVAAGDFSNFQLVNSVSGMANQLIKDPAISGAVSATKTYRTSVENMKKAQQDGKSGPSNDWLFNKKSNEWLNGKTPGESFNTNYKPYNNWRKNATEVIKALTGDSTITDDAFTTDSKGNLVIADAIVRKKVAGISPQKIQQALMVGLSPGDFEQMEIDGMYQYSNVDDNTFATRVSQDYKERYDAIEQRLNVLRTAQDASTSTKDKEELGEKIKNFESALKSIKSEYEDVTKTFSSGDTESAKAKLHTVNSIAGLANSFSYSEVSQTYETNPFAIMAQHRADAEQRWKQFMLEYQQREDHFKLNYALEVRKTEAAEKLVKPYGGVEVPVSQEGLDKLNLQKITDQVNKKDEGLKTSDATFYQSLGKDEAWFNGQLEAYQTNPKAMDPRAKAYFQGTAADRNFVKSNKAMINVIQSEADQKFPTPNLKNWEGKLQLAGEDGNIYTYTPEEVLTWKTSGAYEGIDNPLNPLRMLAKQNAGTPEAERMNTLINFLALYKRNERTKIEGVGDLPGAIQYGFEWLVGKAPRDLTPREITFGKAMREMDLLYGSDYNERINRKNNFINEQIRNKTPYGTGVSYGVPLNNETQKASFGNVLIGLAKIAEDQNGVIAGVDVSASDLRKIAPNIQNANIVTYEGLEGEGKKYLILATDKDGKSVSVPISAEQKVQIFGSQEFDEDPGQAFIAPMLNTLMKMGGSSTALRNSVNDPITSTFSNSAIDADNFPSVQYYNPKANIENIGGNYSIRLSLVDPLTNTLHEDISYPRTGTLSQTTLPNAFFMLNDAAIFELINDRPPTAREMNELKSASKKFPTSIKK